MINRTLFPILPKFFFARFTYFVIFSRSFWILSKAVSCVDSVYQRDAHSFSLSEGFAERVKRECVARLVIWY